MCKNAEFALYQKSKNLMSYLFPMLCFSISSVSQNTEGWNVSLLISSLSQALAALYILFIQKL